MKVGQYKRVKHGQLPGDIPKRDKIRMREDPELRRQARGWINSKIVARTRAVLKERTRREIRDET